MKKVSILILPVFFFLLLSCQKETAEGVPGTGGSMARFTIKDNFLYAVDFEQLHTFDISQPTAIDYKQGSYVGFAIETIFPTEDYLFLGARSGMYIYELVDPSLPNKLSFTPHFISYDPVVVQGDYAYVTLRSGENAAGPNQLMIFDVSQPQSPELLKEYEMSGPRGLGIDGDKLFVCDDVLKVFTVTDGINIDLLHSFDIQALDVIPDAGRLYVVAQDGLYQYSYDGDNLDFLSKLTIPKP